MLNNLWVPKLDSALLIYMENIGMAQMGIGLVKGLTICQIVFQTITYVLII